MRVEPRLVVDPLELVLVVDGHRLRDRRLADEDLAALAGEGRQQGAAVVGARVEVGGEDVLDERGRHQQRGEQDGDDEREPADGGVHRSFTTSVRASATGAGRVRLGQRAPGVVGDAQQDGDQRPVREERGAARRQERHGQAGERDDPGDPADDDEALQRHGEGQAGGEQLAEAVAGAERGAQAALHEQGVEHEDREQPDQPDLLAEARDDEVGLREVGEVGPPAAQARCRTCRRTPCPSGPWRAGRTPAAPRG